MKIPTRCLGKNGPRVPCLGLGFAHHGGGVYGTKVEDNERLAFLDAAYDRGATLWDTADEYSDSEDILGKWFALNPEKRNNVFLATKFAVRTGRQSGQSLSFSVDSSPEYCKQAIEVSLKRLGLQYVDLYYCHRLDKKTPIEKTVEAMAELQKAGKIKHIGLSECSAASLRRAHAVHPISCVQVEYSAFCLAIESPKIKLLETARELGIAVVAYSPLGNGFLTGTLRSKEDFTKPGDQRQIIPWLKDENLAHNVTVIDKLTAIAKAKNITLSQLALAWLLAQGNDILPIPGTTKIHRMEENLASSTVTLTAEEEQDIRKAATEVVGERMQDRTGYTFADTPEI